MSKKDDKITDLQVKIADLENYKVASLLLIGSVAQALDVSWTSHEVATVYSVPGLVGRMTTVISGLRAPGAVRSVAGSRNPEVTTIGLAGGNLVPSNNFDDMDEEIDRANARAGENPAVAPGPAPALALRKDYPMIAEDTLGASGERDTHASWLAVTDIQRELGLDDGEVVPLGVALSEIRDEILRIKNPSGDVSADAAGALSKGDTLGEAIVHNRTAQQSLELELVKARAIIQRVAGAMQISQWDADGTELVERAQRWDSFKHALRKSLDVWRARASATDIEAGTNPVGAIVLELSGFLALLTSHKDLAAWLKNKPKVASDALLSIAPETPAAAKRFELKDLYRIVAASGEHGFGEPWFEDLRKIEGSSVASAEFVNLMNLVILPILARQGA